MAQDQYEYQISSPEFKANPYPAYQKFRETPSFVQVPSPMGKSYFITRREDAEAALREPRFSTNPHTIMPPELIAQVFSDTEFMRAFLTSMMLQDPPDHTRLRRLVNVAFTPRKMEMWAGRVQAITDALLDELPAYGAIDLIESFAYPLPMRVFSEVLGIPVPDREQFRVWSVSFGDSLGDPVKTHSIQPQMADFLQYIYWLIDEKTAHPTQDLISDLIQAEAEGTRLNRQELVGMIITLLIAGNETTVNLISNGMYVLFQHPEQLALLKQDPTLIKGAVEEILRYRGAATNGSERWVQEDFEFRGHHFKKGESVYISIASVNRDAAYCPHAETFDITRKDNQHLAFGFGIHYCLGAPLARIEGQIAIQSLLRRYPNIRANADLGSLRWRPGSTLLGLEKLPVIL